MFSLLQIAMIMKGYIHCKQLKQISLDSNNNSHALRVSDNSLLHAVFARMLTYSTKS